MLGEPDSAHAARYRAFIAARSRLADDVTVAARRRDVRQIVVLGAGLDTTGLRHGGAGDLTVFEVDRPSMQAWKQAHFTRIGLAVLQTVRYVPVDFERGESLSGQLRSAGLDAAAPALFFWLGVVPYLTAGAIDSALALAATHRAAEIVFDYSESPARLSPEARERFELRRRQVELIGEPWITHFEPDALAGLLALHGFGEVDDHERTRLHARYPSALLHPGEAPSAGGAHVVHAAHGRVGAAGLAPGYAG